MTTEFNSLPVTGRKTSEFPTISTIGQIFQFLTWNGIPGDNLKRIGPLELANQLLGHMSATPETLAGNRTVTESDKWVLVLDPDGADRTVTLNDDVTAVVYHSGTADKLTVEGEVLLFGETALAIWNGTDHTVIKFAGQGGSNFLTISFIDITNVSSYLYGGTTPQGDWQINKFAKPAGTKTVANESNNGIYTDLATAWTNRLTLTYA